MQFCSVTGVRAITSIVSCAVFVGAVLLLQHLLFKDRDGLPYGTFNPLCPFLASHLPTPLRHARHVHTQRSRAGTSTRSHIRRCHGACNSVIPTVLAHVVCVRAATKPRQSCNKLCLFSRTPSVLRASVANCLAACCSSGHQVCDLSVRVGHL